VVEAVRGPGYRGAAMAGEPRATGDREIEWQLDAVDLRPVELWLASRDGAASAARVEPGPVRELLDTYLDTGDWRLHRAGWSLRIRERAEGFEATLKSFGERPAGAGPRDRRELSEAVDDGSPGAAGRAPGAVGERVRALAGSRPLQVLFEVITRRRDHAVTVDGTAAAVLSLDDTAIPVPSDERPARLQRVEVELVAPELAPAVQELVDELRAACGLRPADGSKFQAGLLARGLVPPGPPDLGPATLAPGMATGELAFSVLRTQFAAFLRHEPGTRLGEDPEELHDMRVATRRMRAAMSVFREALPVRARSLREELRWVAGLLGGVRDLDVHLEQLGGWVEELPEEDRPAMEPVVAVLRERHAAAREALLRGLDSRRYARLAASMTGMLVRGPLRRSPASRRPAVIAAPELVRRRRRAFRKRGDRLDAASAPEDLHALRIRAKRLRYTVEFVAPLYGGKASAPLLRRLTALQDVLGAHQDARVAVAFIRDLLEEHGAALPVGSVFALGRIAERYGRQEREQRERFPRVYARARGKPWRRLRDEMAKRRAAAEAALPPPRAPRRTPAEPHLQAVPAASLPA
jgi:triphosphatase